MQFGLFDPLPAPLSSMEKAEDAVNKHAGPAVQPGPRGAMIYYFKCQMSSLYSLMVRSLEKIPLQAVLITVMRSHFSLS